MNLEELDGAMADNSGDEPVFPINRVVTIAAPIISTLAGSIAAWLLVHVHFLGLFHFTQGQLSTGVAQLIVFGLVAALTYAAHHKWLTGWQKWEQGILEIQKVAPEVAPMITHPAGDEYDEKAAVAEAEKRGVLEPPDPKPTVRKR